MILFAVVLLAFCLVLLIIDVALLREERNWATKILSQLQQNSEKEIWSRDDIAKLFGARTLPSAIAILSVRVDHQRFCRNLLYAAIVVLFIGAAIDAARGLWHMR